MKSNLEQYQLAYEELGENKRQLVSFGLYMIHNLYRLKSKAIETVHSDTRTVI